MPSRVYPKKEFAKQVGISENYLNILTGNSRPGSNLNKTISPILTKLIAVTFGHRVEWILHGELPERKKHPPKRMPDLKGKTVL